MGRRKGGYRRKKRLLFRKETRKRGKISLTQYVQEFNKGERVQLSVEPAIQTGMYHPRFYGKSGIVKSKQGTCYNVQIHDGNKEKTVVVHPVHLKRSA
ncbi:50S ribosomal protein L21e [Candidatus Woesearchaeota archaeon]|nr:50S ribosomal protein L21e [Candidatus Woesearchaeota archaeon]